MTNPCSNCSTFLQHCLEMRNPCELDDVAATACCNRCLLHSSARLHERAAGAFPEIPTRDLRPGDTVRSAGPTIRTVRENRIRTPDSVWHTLYFQDGTYLWSQAADIWTLVSPPEIQYAVRNTSGEIFPMPSRAYAHFVVDGGGPDLEAVSRTVPPWEVLR